MQGMKRIAVRAAWLLPALVCPSLALAQQDVPAPMAVRT